MQHEFHPVANVFPLMLESELAELASDIAANGLREAIWLDQAGKIIDGRNRYLACQRAKVAPAFRTFDGADPITFAVSMNMKRRHLNEVQRGAVAAQIANLTNGNTIGQRSAGHVCPAVSTDEAAALLNVSPSTVKNAKIVLARGTPEEVEAMKAGEIGVATLAEDIRAGVPPEERGKNRPKIRNTSSRVKLAPGVSMEDWARKGLAMRAKGKPNHEIARDLGLGHVALGSAMDIVLLNERDDLSDRDRELAKRALDDMNEFCQPAKAHEIVAGIVERIWGAPEDRRSSGRERIEERRLADFDRAYGMVVQVCRDAPSIDLPYLSKERAGQIAAELEAAARSIRDLRKRIMEIHA